MLAKNQTVLVLVLLLVVLNVWHIYSTSYYYASTSSNGKDVVITPQICPQQKECPACPSQKETTALPPSCPPTKECDKCQTCETCKECPPPPKCPQIPPEIPSRVDENLRNKLLNFPLDINVCMPSFPRKNDKDYITNAIGSYISAFAPFRANITIFNSVYQPGVDHHVALEHMLDVYKDHTDHVHVITRDPSVEVMLPRKLTHNDSPDRCKWRSKEAQDYAYTLNYCHNLDKSKPVLIIQDDTQISSLFKHINAIVTFSVKPLPRNWFFVSFFDVFQNINMGPIKNPFAMAKMYNPAYIDEFVSFVRENYDEDPIDWMQDKYGKNNNYGMYVYVPNLVQHTGVVSSFEGNSERTYNNDMSKTFIP